MSTGYQLRSRGQLSDMPQKVISAMGKTTQEVDDITSNSAAMDGKVEATISQVQPTNNDVIIAAIPRISQRLDSSESHINER